MHTLSYQSFRLLTDGGEVKGPMYLKGREGDAEIVVTEAEINEAIERAGSNKQVSITGPDSEFHDRHDVTAEMRANGRYYERIQEGEWKTQTVTVDVDDLKVLMMYSDADAIQSELDKLDMMPSDYAETRKTLQSIKQMIKDIR